MTCDHQYVGIEKHNAVTPQGIFGVILFIIGVCLLTLNLLIGIVIAVTGVLIGMIGRSKAAIICAKCGEHAPHQS